MVTDGSVGHLLQLCSASGSWRGRLSLVSAVWLVGCSLQNFDHLSDGKSGGVGGLAGTGGDAQGGDTSTAETGGIGGDPQTGTSVEGGADSGGTAGVRGEGPADAGCTDLLRGSPLGATVTNCGECGFTCSVTNAGSASCSNGTCVPACSAGFADCNGSTQNDGCEVDTTSVGHCGRCGHACAAAGVAAKACTSGACAPTCLPKYGDCRRDDGSADDDGCESYLDMLTACGTTCENRVACTADKVCNNGVCGAPQGIVVLSIPFTQTGTQRYADKFPTVPDLTGTTLVMRVYAPGAKNGNLSLFLTDQNYNFSTRSDFPLDLLSQGWTDITVNIGGVSGAFNPAAMYQLTYDVSATGTGPWANPTVVYVDSIRTTNGMVNDHFDASAGSTVASSLSVVTGATFTWVDTLP